MGKVLWFINGAFYITALISWAIISNNWILNLSLMALAFTMSIILILIFGPGSQLRKIFKLIRDELTSSLAFVTSIVLLNGVIFQLDLEKDLSAEKKHTLADKTIKVLNKIENDTHMHFFSHQKDWPVYKRILNLYKNESDKISLKMHDINFDFLLAKSYEVEEAGTLVIKQGSKKINLKLDSELSLTNAFLKLVRKEKPKIYILSGHKEYSINESNEFGLSYFKKILNSEYIEIIEWNISKNGVIPEDASALMIIQPQEDFLVSEIEVLNKYQKLGKGIILLMGATILNERWNNLEAWLRSNWGVIPQDDFILDKLANLQGVEATMPLIAKFNQSHVITKGVKFRVIAPFSRSFQIEKIDGVSSSILGWSHQFPGSWAEKSLEELKAGKVAYDEDQDREGPLGMAAVFEKNEGKLFYLSSSQALLNRFARFEGGFNLVLNGIEWLIGSESFSSLNRASIKGQRVYINQVQIKILSFIYAILLPMIFTFFGFLFFWRKRKL